MSLYHDKAAAVWSVEHITSSAVAGFANNPYHLGTGYFFAKSAV